MVFDPVRRRLILSGCYQRFAGTGAGEPGSGKCGVVQSNLLRIADVDAQGSAVVQIYDLYKDVLSSETTQLLLADPDPVTQAPRTLWATVRQPDALVQIELPASYTIEPRVRRVIPIPLAPADMMLIPRPGASDLIAVVGELTGSVAIYDVGQDQVVTLVERLGTTPFTLASVPCPAGTNSACLAATVFGECRVAFLEVPLDQPQNATLRGRAGGCL
jgi:hypothetical protein